MKQDKLLACVNFWKKKKVKCNGKYCSKCIEKHYRTDLEFQKKTIGGWICFSCQGLCTCAVCKRKRGDGSSARNIQKSILKLQQDSDSFVEVRYAHHDETNDLSPNQSLPPMQEYSFAPIPNDTYSRIDDSPNQFCAYIPPIPTSQFYPIQNGSINYQHSQLYIPQYDDHSIINNPITHQSTKKTNISFLINDD